MSENKAVFSVFQLAPDLWQLHEEGAGQDVDSYLIVGSERAALVDSLMSRGDRRLYELVREKTDLPVTVLHTHGHGDHVGAELQEFIDAGCGVYVSPKDFPIMGSFGASYPAEVFQPLSQGMEFPLGGCTLEVIEVPGHTPGSVVFLDREHGRLFSGDSVGSGAFWVQLGHSLPLSVLLEAVKKLKAKLADFPELLIYPGHRSQSPVQLTGGYIDDLEELLEGILSGEITGETPPYAGPVGSARVLAAGHGAVLQMLYDADRLRG